MVHIAILSKSWHLMEKLLDGQKVIESRWYKVKTAPWNKVHKGETIYFKNSGEKIVAKSIVKDVLQFENLDEKMIREILQKYGEGICLSTPYSNEPLSDFYNGRKYCILVFLKKVHPIEPFDIDKSKAGFGTGAAWIITENIEKIRKQY